MTEALTIATAPWILSMVGGESAVTDYMWTVARIPNVTVRFVRGRKMMTLGALFDEFGAALQFPYYFGENMAAFSECISDLSWISGDAYVICIIDSELVLSESSNELMLFMKVMSRVAEGWSKPDQFRPAKSFHVVFQQSMKDGFVDRLRNAGVQVGILQLPV